MSRSPCFSLFAGALLGAALLSCAGCMAQSQLTVAGSYAGTEEKECQLALRAVEGDHLVDTVSVGKEFRQVFSVDPQRAAYFVQVSCDDGKSGRSPVFYFEPPKSGMQLNEISLN